MKRWKVFILTLSILMLVGAPLAWYFAPVKIEDMDHLIYCSCGYAKVQFKDGIITMVEYHHDSPKPGEVIGRYTVRDRRVDLEVVFNGNPMKSIHTIDNIGLYDPAPMMWRDYYVAIQRTSAKYRVWCFLYEMRRDLIELVT